jgi:methionyl-tRNA formyltransferase
MISLFLMSKKGLLVLQSLIDNGFIDIIDKVVASKDNSIPYDYYDNIKSVCKENNILFFDKNEDYTISSDFAFAISWRWILKLENTKLIIFHDSLLPKYRGFNPLVSCLMNRESKIGVTALFASEEFDTGPVISQCSKDISYPIKLSDAVDVVSEAYASLCLKIAKQIRMNENIASFEQKEEEATYSVWRDEEDYRIDWTKSSNDICLKIDSLGPPYNGASCYIEGRKVRILEAEVYENLSIENRSSGKLLLKKDGFPVIICGEGLLLIKSAIYDDNKESIFPLKKFRIRFS